MTLQVALGAVQNFVGQLEEVHFLFFDEKAMSDFVSVARWMSVSGIGEEDSSIKKDKKGDVQDRNELEKTELCHMQGDSQEKDGEKSDTTRACPVDDDFRQAEIIVAAKALDHSQEPDSLTGKSCQEWDHSGKFLEDQECATESETTQKQSHMRKKHSQRSLHDLGSNHELCEATAECLSVKDVTNGTFTATHASSNRITWHKKSWEVEDGEEESRRKAKRYCCCFFDLLKSWSSKVSHKE